MNIDFSKIQWTDENINYPMERWCNAFAAIAEGVAFTLGLTPRELTIGTWNAAIGFHISREAELARRRMVVN